MLEAPAGPRWLTSASSRWVVVALAIAPLARLIAGVPLGWLGVNPLEYLIRATGEWTLIMLALTLSVTPVRRLTGWTWLHRYRRSFGRLTFLYGLTHFVVYLVFDMGLDWSEILRDIAKRPFVTVGFTAFVLLACLAATSSDRAIRVLGAARWRMLHRAVYAVAVLGVIHYLWLVRADVTKPVIYGSIFALLFAIRIGWAWRQHLRTRRDAGVA
ncbi:MAG: sulfoxide reductase heme-binding subunit YedZ [Casimicrobiaceae bacterium]|nr:sulfoxide reductase heme-binding subunit YedZ [Casimicrobiaceae bacterium]MCX8097431.1 sulfoxide reductase heme-binding subunit YedZ [Casimicrobiaceae bacterium]MDW8312065.1 protein-methionine-sulfoxide reductase heme-binding subunit MsrQ [Burkholderiales bacterium]